jgi:hypothetical protein
VRDIPLWQEPATVTEPRSYVPLTRASFYADARKYLPQTSFAFDTAILQQLRPQALNNVHHRKPGWFLSAGVVVNDYSTGAEIQFGIRSLYLVVSPAVLGTGSYYGAYGIGTSIAIDQKLSLTPAYTFSNKNDKQYYQELSYDNVLFGESNTRARHHQFKLLAQYTLSRNIQVRVGPVLNLYASRTRYTNTIAATRVAVRGQYYDAANRSGYAVAVPAMPVLVSSYQLEADHYTRRWIGWQASISYRLNFSGNR